MKRVIASFMFDSGNGSVCKIEFDSSTQKIKAEGEMYPGTLKIMSEFQKIIKDNYPPVLIPVQQPTTK